MDWIKLAELLITSLTSIIIALLGAGYFRKMTIKKEKNKSKESLMQQIKNDEIVHLSIREIRRRYNADRVYIWQFHNGGSFYTSSPMQKISITYERNSDGLERKADKKNQQRNNALLISCGTFLYAFFAIWGAGIEMIIYSLILILIGMPIYLLKQ